MKIKKLIRDLPSITLKGPKEIAITGVTANSKLVGPGNLFIARKGLHHDGSHYISHAIDAGASAIATDIFDPTFKDIAQLIHPDIASIEGQLAANFHQHPSDHLYLVGITGTNGKTTTSYLVKHLLDALELSCGLIGTVEYIIGKNRHLSTHTTPDACSNQKMLRDMLTQGCQSAVMEVSSHALDQQRVANIEFDAAIYTNLTLEHLDYHGSMENYAAAKQKLFHSISPDLQKKIAPWPKTCIINNDCSWSKTLTHGCRSNILSYAIETNADLKASQLEINAKGSRFLLTYQNQQAPCEIPLIGLHNIYNVMAAICVGLSRQHPLEYIVSLMQHLPSIPGRLEKIPNAAGLNIYVDFAHSPDSLKNVLACLDAIKQGRLITVFGCGGDRDKGKRPLMAAIAERYSDITIVTSDNPRSEDPIDICQQVASGFSGKKGFEVDADRKSAIEKAIREASVDDIVLIAGRGHESHQLFAHCAIPFDDRLVVREICSTLV